MMFYVDVFFSGKKEGTSYYYFMRISLGECFLFFDAVNLELCP